MTWLKTYWSQLNDRERVMMIVAGGCLLLYVYYALFYSTLDLAVQQKKDQVIEARSTWMWMQSVKQRDMHTKSLQTLSNGQLLTVFGQQLNQTSFQSYPYQLEQTSSGDIQLSFDQIPYHVFVTWLRNMTQHYAFTIKQLNMDKTDATGIVKVNLICSSH